MLTDPLSRSFACTCYLARVIFHSTFPPVTAGLKRSECLELLFLLSVINESWGESVTVWREREREEEKERGRGSSAIVHVFSG